MQGAGLGKDRVIVDTLVTPELFSGTPALLPYIDNLNVVGTNKAKVQEAIDRATARLREVGFIVHEETSASPSVSSLGYVIDGKHGPKTRR